MNMLEIVSIYTNASRIAASRACVHQYVMERTVEILILTDELLADLRRHPEMTPPGVEQRVNRIYNDVESALRSLTN